ncbi:MAG: Holliday junction resolvase RuvX [Pseudomonadales bacterium]|nr:Holliday junction resolvase RuvX [Pseudomonadales bacterium]MCP5183417.1 Holliday junction resolvase RuvX [Pseudomonadales bacterium]
MPDTSADIERVLGFDFGLQSIGVAVGQSITATATPLPVLPARNGKPDWQRVATLIREWKVNHLVVGLPLNMDDTDNPVTVKARAFATALTKRFALPVTLVDERLTTREAMEITGGDRARGHGVAAALLVESYLR